VSFVKSTCEVWIPSRRGRCVWSPCWLTSPSDRDVPVPVRWQCDARSTSCSSLHGQRAVQPPQAAAESCDICSSLYSTLLPADTTHGRYCSSVILFSKVHLISLTHFCLHSLLPPPRPPQRSAGARFSKNLTINLRKTYEKVWITKNLGWGCDYQKILQKSYEKLRTKLCKTYEKLTTTSQASYENVKFAASDVIRETLSQRQILWLLKYSNIQILWSNTLS